METPRARIAVVDDEASICKALDRLLRSAGMEVETYLSGMAFLKAVQTRYPDCMVLDVHMPELDGFEVQSRLALCGIVVPTVVITGHYFAGSRERALAGGASAYLLKPIDDRLLLDAISDAIKRVSGDP
jgi:FixJ family two-component response regulator